jgi:1,4-alpha-glucan branching enzyme
MYAFTENYVLPISHDEVVHGKLSFINKMYGAYEDKFSQMRTALMLIMTYPGKKMLFMGTEYGQFREWDYSNSLEWFMLDYPNHYQLRQYVAALNRYYLSTPELWTYDFDQKGFEWILPDEAEKNVVAYRRLSEKSQIIVVINFSGTEQQVSIPIKDKRPLELEFSTLPDNHDNSISYLTEGSSQTAKITVPAFSGGIYKQIPKSKKISL